MNGRASRVIQVILGAALLIALCHAPVCRAGPSGPVWIQTDWSGGPGQPVTANLQTDRFDRCDGGVDWSAPGRFGLASGTRLRQWHMSGPGKYAFDPAKVQFVNGTASLVGGPGSYPTDNPTVTCLAGQRYLYLTGFQDSYGPGHQGEVRYQVSLNGSDWLYHDGSGWSVATAGYLQTNSASEVNARIAGLGAGGTFFFRAFLHSDGIQQVVLDSVELAYFGYSAGGVLTSSTLLAGDDVLWGEVGWDADVPAGCAVVVMISTDEGYNFKTVTSGSLLNTVAPSIKYRVLLSSSDPLLTPVFKQFYVRYHYRIVDTSSSEATVSPEVVPADGVSTSTLKVCVKSITGGVLPGHLLSATSDRRADEFSADTFTSGPDGLASVKISSTVPGTSTITVSDLTAGVVIEQKPKVCFTPLWTERTSPTNSKISLSADSCKADGSTVAEIGIYLMDGEMRPVEGHTVRVASSRAFDVIEQPVKPTDGEGFALAGIRSSEPGTCSITATDLDDNVVLAQQPTLTFTREEPSAENTEIPEADYTREDRYSYETPDEVPYYQEDFSGYMYPEELDFEVDPEDGERPEGEGSPDFSRSTLSAGSPRSSNLRKKPEVLPGEIITVIINVVNTGEAAGEGVRVQAVVPENTTYIPNSTIGTGFSEKDTRWNLGRVSSNGVVRVAYQVQVNKNAKAGAKIRFKATVSCSNGPTVNVGSNAGPAGKPLSLEVASRSMGGAALKSPWLWSALALVIVLAVAVALLALRQNRINSEMRYRTTMMWYYPVMR